MKRSMIAVCLLLLSPGTVIACFEDHNAGAGWFDANRCALRATEMMDEQ